MRPLLLVLSIFCLPIVSSADSINLLLNKPATANVAAIGENYDGTCCGAFWAVDGLESTHWSGYFAPAWWQGDLQTPQAVSEIRYLGANNSFDLFADNVFLASGATSRENGWWIYSFAAPLTLQLIRFDFTGGSDWAVAWEVQAFGPADSGVPEAGTFGLLALAISILGLRRLRS